MTYALLDMKRSYSTDLSDDKWGFLEPTFRRPKGEDGRGSTPPARCSKPSSTC